MEVFEALFERQRENQDLYNGHIENPYYMASMLLAMNEEVAELARELAGSWKTWKPHAACPQHVCDEAADVFIFLMNILNAFDITVDEFATTVERKQFVNRERADHLRVVE